MSKRPLYCWDTSAFLAWFNSEPLADEPATKAVVQEIESNKCSLLVPAHVYTEFLEAHNADKMEDFRAFLGRRNVTAANITVQLAKRAEQIRTAAKRGTPSRSIKASDSLFIAVAVAYKAKMLHTKDSGMIGLSGSPIVDGLIICHPRCVSGEQSFA